MRYSQGMWWGPRHRWGIQFPTKHNPMFRLVVFRHGDRKAIHRDVRAPLADPFEAAYDFYLEHRVVWG